MVAKLVTKCMLTIYDFNAHERIVYCIRDRKKPVQWTSDFWLYQTPRNNLFSTSTTCSRHLKMPEAAVSRILHASHQSDKNASDADDSLEFVQVWRDLSRCRDGQAITRRVSSEHRRQTQRMCVVMATAAAANTDVALTSIIACVLLFHPTTTTSTINLLSVLPALAYVTLDAGV